MSLLLLQYNYDYNYDHLSHLASKVSETHRRGLAMAGDGFAKAYLSHPIAPEDLALRVVRLPMVTYHSEGSIYPRRSHYSERPFYVRMTCNKVGKKGRIPGVVCTLMWGITDCEDNVRKANTRYLYVQARRDWHKHEENWQP